MAALSTLKKERDAKIRAIDTQIAALEKERDGVEKTYDKAITLISPTGAEPAKNARGRETRKTIRNTIFKLGKRFTTGDALDALGDQYSRPTIHKEMNAMVADGALMKAERGVWERVGA